MHLYHQEKAIDDRDDVSEDEPIRKRMKKAQDEMGASDDSSENDEDVKGSV